MNDGRSPSTTGGDDAEPSAGGSTVEDTDEPQPPVPQSRGVDASEHSDESEANPLEQFRALVRSQCQVETVLQSVCEQVTATIAGADMAGVTLLREGLEHPETAALTDVRVFDVDLDQYRANEGPCLESARTRSIVRVRVGDVGSRWPAFAANVAGMGIGSYLSAPLSIDDQHLGALNIYSLDDHGFTDVEVLVVKVFVTAVEAAVWNSRRAQLAQTELDGLQEAMKTRAAIEQAKGIVMAARGISAQGAFAVLAEQSQNSNVKVFDVARRLIDSITTEGS